MSKPSSTSTFRSFQGDDFIDMGDFLAQIDSDQIVVAPLVHTHLLTNEIDSGSRALI